MKKVLILMVALLVMAPAAFAAGGKIAFVDTQTVFDKTKVGKISMKQVEDIAKQKLVDLNSTDLQASMRQVMGTASSMGVEVR